jgi:hypothetical protein
VETLCEQLNCKPNEGAQFLLFASIHNLCERAKPILKDVRVLAHDRIHYSRHTGSN